MVQRPEPSVEPKVADEAPSTPEITNYDHEMLICYLRLLDTEVVGADWREVARVVLKADPDREYARAKQMYDTHLARARWMTKQGYRHLLSEADGER